MLIPICRYWSSTGSTRSDSHWAAEFHRQRTYRLEQSATSTTFAGSVAERLQSGTEDASLLIRSATLSRFETLPLLINLPTYLLTYPWNFCSSGANVSRTFTPWNFRTSGTFAPQTTFVPFNICSCGNFAPVL